MTVDDLRVGSGFDVHPFSADPTRALVLGGVTMAGARGLVGHSDADVIAHACAEALLGNGDIECGCGLGRHDGPSTSIGIPETLVGVPAVIACTTSCCVVAVRS